MKKFTKLLLLLLCLVLLLCGCGEKQPEYTENPRLVGIWQMTTYVTDAGESYDFTDKNVIFTYNDDGSGNKTVDGVEEYIFTFAYDGENLYTTAAYPDNKISVMHDKTTVNDDTITTYSYDEKATVTLKKIGVPATKTTAKTTTETSGE